MTVALLEVSAEERRRRVSDAATAFELNAELTPQRYFWLVPRLVIEDLA